MQTEKDPANVGRCSKIHFIAVFRILSCFYHRVAYNGLCQVVSDQFRPDLLLYEFNLIGMEGAGFLTLVNRIIWQKPHNCGFFYVKFIKF